MPRKPWSGVIPDEDLASFSREFDNEDRPLSAGTKPALLIIDMTRAFVDSTYPTGWSPTGAPAVQANAELLSAARRAHLPIFFTRGYPGPDDPATPSERGRWKRAANPRPLPPGTPPGDVIAEPPTPHAGEVVIDKGAKPSGFFGTALSSYLIYEGCDTVIVTGMTTSGCVRATVLDAFQYNFHVVVPHECCADRSQISHKVSLFDMHMKYGDVIDLSETIAYIESLSSQQHALSAS